MKAIRTFKAFHYLLAPTPIRVDPDADEKNVVLARRSYKSKRQRKAEKTKARKPSCIDSIDSTLILCKDNEIVKEKVAAFGVKQAKKKLMFNPIIACTEDQSEVPIAHYVWIDNFYLECPNFKNAVNSFVQSFHVFDVRYPPEGANVCKALLQLFYGIDSDDATVSNFVKDLEAEMQKIKENDGGMNLKLQF